MSPEGGADFRHVREYAPGMGVPRPVSANDPRIPPPAPDSVVWTSPGAPPLVVPPTVKQVMDRVVEETSGVQQLKYGIYSRKGDGFNIAALDADGDPIEMRSASAEVIETVVKPMLEAAGHKIVNYAGIDYSEEAKRIRESLSHADDAFKAMAKQPDPKIRPMRRAV